MSVGPGEQENNGQDQPPSGGHPAWREILDQLPDELHGLVTPKLEEWDRGVQERFSEIHQQYNPYKDLIEAGVDPDYLQQAVALTQQLQENPAELVGKMIEHFELTEYQKAQLQQEQDELVDLSDTGFDLEDLRKDPRFKEFVARQDEILEKFNSQQQSEEEAEQEEELNAYLKELHDKFDEKLGFAFSDEFVVAMLANDIDGEVAVQQFQATVNQAAQRITGNSDQQTPGNGQAPVVLGSGGTTGSGIPAQDVDFGKMPRGEINDLVTDYLKKAAEN